MTAINFFGGGFMPAVGLIGYRGMVGSVLFGRMQAENDFAHFDPVFFRPRKRGRRHL
jgi:aspartate-semialdehyde dehydrogenase